MRTLRLIPLDDTVVLPGMQVTLPVDVGGDERVFLAPRHGTRYARVGVVADVVERGRVAGGRAVATVSALHRGVAGAAAPDPAGHLRVEVDERPDVSPPPARTRALVEEYRAVAAEILEIRGDDGRLGAFLRSIVEPGALADTAAYAPDLDFGQRLALLETLDVVERLGLAVRLLRERLAELQLRKRIRDDVESDAQKQQREYLLRRQMQSIR